MPPIPDKSFLTPEEAKKFGLIDHIVTSREDIVK